MPTETSELWHRAGRGDPDAVQAVLERCVAIARSELRRKGASTRDVEDLTQETAATVLAYLRSGGEVRTSLHGFLKHRAWGVLSNFRARGRLRRTEDLEAAPEPRASGPGPTAGLLEAELREAITDCLDRLKGPLRTTVEMRYIQKLTTERIATKQGIRTSTVNVRVFRAMRELRGCLEAKGEWEAGS